MLVEGGANLGLERLDLTLAGTAGYFGFRSNAGTPSTTQEETPPAGVEEVHFTAADGVELRGWWWPGRDASKAVVLLHGFRSNRLQMFRRMQWLHDTGYASLIFDFRGCGVSGSRRGQMFIGTEWPQDLQAALTYLETRPEVDLERIAAIGSSWGGGVTIFTAAVDRRIRCAISLAAPANGKRWLQTQWTTWHGKTGWEQFQADIAANRRRLVADGHPAGRPLGAAGAVARRTRGCVQHRHHRNIRDVRVRRIPAGAPHAAAPAGPRSCRPSSARTG